MKSFQMDCHFIEIFDVKVLYSIYIYIYIYQGNTVVDYIEVKSQKYSEKKCVFYHKRNTINKKEDIH